MKTIIGVLLISVLFGCNSNTANDNHQENVKSVISENQSPQEKSDQKFANPQPKINNEDGPPFSDTCDCSFDYLGGFESGNNRYDLFISGKGWNPNYWSCTYTFGELINNEFPPDTTITDFRIHLVDLSKIKKLDIETFNSSIIQKNIIATQRFAPKEEFKCQFDPNKTGKYPKPKQWVE